MADGEGPQSRQRRRLRGAAAVGAALSSMVALVTVFGSVREDSITSVERGLPAAVLVLAVVAVVSALTASWAVWAQRPLPSIGLSVATVSSLLPVWAAWTSLPGAVRAGVLAAAPLAVGGAAQIGLRWSPADRRSLRLRLVWGLVGLAAAAHLLGYDPFADPSCRRTCEGIDPIGRDVITTQQTVAVTAALTVAAVVVAIAALVGRPRRAPLAIIAGTVIALLLLGCAAMLRWATVDNFSRPEGALVTLGAAALLVLGPAVDGVAIRTRRIRRAIDRLVDAFADPTAARLGFGGAIRDVQFAVPGEAGRWIGATGQDVEGMLTDATTAELSDELGAVLRLVLPPGTNDVDLVDLSPAARLALRNGQLAAVAKARLLDAQASRRRVVATSDTERRRIERDLHDGAQQRLVSASFYLSVAHRRFPGDAAQLASAEANVREALSNLRALAHGIFPAVLGAEGLHAALEDHAATVDVPTTLIIDADDVRPLDTAMAAYATVVAALQAARRAHATSALVTVDRRNGTVNLRVEAHVGSRAPETEELLEVVDRVGAVGGELHTSSTDGDLIVSAVLPCA